MRYDYFFALASIPFITLIITFYLMQKRLRDINDRLFTIMLFGSGFAVFFDFMSSFLDSLDGRAPIWLLYLVNILLFACTHICMPAFFNYILNAAGYSGNLTRFIHTLIITPYVLTVVALLISPLGKFGVFYINEAGKYTSGLLHPMLYIDTGVYMLACIITLICVAKMLKVYQRVLIFVFISVAIVSTAFQSANPYYVISSSSTALAITAVFYIFRLQGAQVDPVTGAFSKSTLPQILGNMRDTGKPFTVLLYSIDESDGLSHKHNFTTETAVITEFCQRLLFVFSDDIVIYMEMSEYLVIHRGDMSKREFLETAKRIPDSVKIRGVEYSTSETRGDSVRR